MPGSGMGATVSLTVTLHAGLKTQLIGGAATWAMVRGMGAGHAATATATAARAAQRTALDLRPPARRDDLVFTGLPPSLVLPWSRCRPAFTCRLRVSSTLTGAAPRQIVTRVMPALKDTASG